MRDMFSIANKLEYDSSQMDVKTAFLNGIVDYETYMKLSEGMNYTEQERKNKVCKLERFIYGLKVSPKK